MSSQFYITTPLYYVNGEPHIGHAYTTILADVLARYHRLFDDRQVHFLTGLDEHGQKVSQSATERKVTPQQHCDRMAETWKEVWYKLGISNDDFIRTTEPRHEKVVIDFLNKVYEKGDVYKQEYDGWYSVYEERYFTEKDLVDGKDPICGRPVERRKETNYFFEMSKYQDWLIKHYEDNPDAVLPAFRLNEVKGFLKQPLGDLCISRPMSRLDWGIPIPWDDDYVTYVWFDALINYFSATKTPPVGLKVDWPADYHLIGKDILTTHAIYWPIMLYAAGYEPPKHILAHGWWLDKSDARMSKSDGNVIEPLVMAEKYGSDEFRYFVMKEMVVGQDAGFSEEIFVQRINSDLANDLGNLYSRFAKLYHQFGWSKYKLSEEKWGSFSTELAERAHNLESVVKREIEALRPHAAIEEIMMLIRGLNQHVEHLEPWKNAKIEPDKTALAMLDVLDALMLVAELLVPVMPAKMALLKQWIDDDVHVPQKTEQLFPRIDMKKLKLESAKAEKSDNPAEMTIDDFAKLDLRVGVVTSAKKAENSDKLLVVEVEISSEKRQVVAGIAGSYSPDELIGKRVIVVSNLKPVKLRGILSQGMLLAAGSGEEIGLLTLDKDIPSGAKIH
ncbi:methionine--tRNA ligase [bacterium]|nr:methionine--tRNA ligase [bacterium]